MKKLILYIFLLIIFGLSAQSNLFIDSARMFEKLKNGRQFLIDNVKIRYGIYGVTCDTAIVNKEMNRAELYGNVVFWDTSRVVKTGYAYLFKKEGMNRIRLSRGVVIDQDTIVIKGLNANYDEVFEEGVVTDSVEVYYKPYPSKLESKLLSYKKNDSEIYSNSIRKVTYIDSSFRYRMKTKWAYYYTDRNYLKIPSKFEIEIFPLEKYEDNFKDLRLNKFYSLFDMPVDSNSTYGFLKAQKGNYDIENEYLELFGNVEAIMTDTLGLDTTYLYSDTLLYDMRLGKVRSYGNVKVVRDTLSVVSKRAFFDIEEKILKFQGNPKIHMNKDLATGDSVTAYFKDGKGFYPYRINLKGNGHLETISNPDFEGEKNSMNGKEIDMYFENKDIKKIKVAGQATVIYFIQDQKDKAKESTASNFVTGDTLIIDLDNKELKDIQIIGGAEGTYYPKKYRQRVFNRK